MKLKKVLLTGGGGLVGRELVDLLKQDYDITHFDVTEPNDGHPCITGDLRDSDAVTKACEGMDAVIHIAALHGAAWNKVGDDMGFEVNVTGTKNILAGAVKAGIKRVVFTSSIWATGHDSPAPDYLPIDENLKREPLELYGFTKILGERMCRYYSTNHEIETIVLRPGGILSAERYSSQNGGLLTCAVDVRDVAQAHVLSLKGTFENRHEVFIITADSPLRHIDPTAFKKDPVTTLDSVVPGAAALVAEGKLTINAAAEWYTIEKAKRLLGYCPKYNFSL